MRGGCSTSNKTLNTTKVLVAKYEEKFWLLLKATTTLVVDTSLDTLLLSIPADDTSSTLPLLMAVRPNESIRRGRIVLTSVDKNPRYSGTDYSGTI